MSTQILLLLFISNCLPPLGLSLCIHWVIVPVRPRHRKGTAASIHSMQFHFPSISRVIKTKWVLLRCFLAFCFHYESLFVTFPVLVHPYYGLYKTEGPYTRPWDISTRQCRHISLVRTVNALGTGVDFFMPSTGILPAVMWRVPLMITRVHGVNLSWISLPLLRLLLIVRSSASFWFQEMRLLKGTKITTFLRLLLYILALLLPLRYTTACTSIRHYFSVRVVLVT